MQSSLAAFTGIRIPQGTGIRDNVADKAKKLGIPVYRFGSGGA